MLLMEAADKSEILLAQDLGHDYVRLQFQDGSESGQRAIRLTAQGEVGCLLEPFGDRRPGQWELIHQKDASGPLWRFDFSLRLHTAASLACFSPYYWTAEEPGAFYLQNYKSVMAGMRQTSNQGLNLRARSLTMGYSWALGTI
jgi:hypothetical protein